jgi:hypothetical protein
MKNSLLASLWGLVAMTTALGCAPVDNLVGEEQVTSVGGRNAVGDGVGGAKGGTSAVSFGGTTAVSLGGSNSNCELNVAHTSPHSVEVIVKNERDAPIYLESGKGGLCSFGETMTILDSRGKRLSQEANCECSIAMEMGGCPIASCAMPKLLRIEPGSSKTFVWDGNESVGRDVPPYCAPKNATNFQCDLMVPAASGTYRLAVNGSTDWTCEDDTKCSCDAINGCLAGSMMTRAGTLLEPSVTFDLYSTSTVTVVFTNDLGYL